MQNDLEIREGLIHNDIVKADKSVWVCHQKKLKTSQSEAAPFLFFQVNRSFDLCAFCNHSSQFSSSLRKSKSQALNYATG